MVYVELIIVTTSILYFNTILVNVGFEFSPHTKNSHT